MPYQKMSAILNNCPLHTLAPELTQEIIKFSQDSQYDNGFNPAYLHLKNCFAEVFKLQSDTFTWQAFAGILSNYNPFDIQILMGITLRRFMKDQLKHNVIFKEMHQGLPSEDMQHAIDDDTEIVTEDKDPEKARYRSLSSDQMFAYAYAPLGFNITAYVAKDHTPIKIPINPLPQPIGTITVYHEGGDGAGQGGHWEREPDAQNQIDYSFLPDSKLKKLSDLLGQDLLVNPIGFKLLTLHVQIIAKQSPLNVTLEQLNKAIDYVVEYQLLHSVMRATQNDKELKDLGQPNEATLGVDCKRFILNALHQHLPSSITTAGMEAVKEAQKKPSPTHEQTTPQAQPSRKIDPIENDETKHKVKNFQELSNKFWHQLSILEGKMNELTQKSKNDPRYAKASRSATALHRDLSKAGETFFNQKPTQVTYDIFKTTCNRKINASRKTLAEHRGWRGLLAPIANILILIASIGTALGYTLPVLGRWGVFSTRTDSEEKVNAIQKTIDEFNPDLKT